MHSRAFTLTHKHKHTTKHSNVTEEGNEKEQKRQNGISVHVKLLQKRKTLNKLNIFHAWVSNKSSRTR